MAAELTPRSAYLLTKLAVFVVAAALTWPLSRVVGPKAWWGLAAFGAILVLMSVVVVLASSSASAVAAVDDHDPAGAADDPDPDDAVVIPVEDSLDLHAFPPKDIPAVVADYLEEAHRIGFTEVRLIHGRGIGVQRERVRSLLAKHPLVAAYHDATPDRGGWGATIAILSRGDKMANFEL